LADRQKKYNGYLARLCNPNRVKPAGQTTAQTPTGQAPVSQAPTGPMPANCGKYASAPVRVAADGRQFPWD
jgi:hypothetical protein